MENKPQEDQPITRCPKCGAISSAKKKENGVVIAVCMQVGCSHEWALPQVKAAAAK